MDDTQRDLVILQLIDQMSTRRQWCGAVYLQALSYLFEQSTRETCNFDHYWYRGGPYSSVVADSLEALRSDGLLTYAPVIPSSGPSYLCTPNGQKKLEGVQPSKFAQLVETFLNHPGNQRLLLARAAYAIANHSENALSWLQELGANTEQANLSLKTAQELLASQCRAPMAR